MSSSLSSLLPDPKELKFLCVAGFYLFSNFILFYLPPVAYFAWHGNLLCRLLCLLTLVDYLCPLRLPSLWLAWCEFTNDVAGKTSYFDMETVWDDDTKFSKSKNYLLVYHPHSIFGIAFNVMTMGFYEKFGTIPLFTGADVIFKLPIVRRMLAWWGGTPVSGAAMKKNLQRPHPYNALTLWPGGVYEMFYGLDQEQIILSKRKGFAKIALQTGASLVPVYTFGANEVWTRLFRADSLAAKLSSRLQTSLVVWVGRWGIPFGVVPHKKKLVLVIGEPIDVEKCENPTPSQIETLHAEYVARLKALYEKHKHRMGEEWATKRPRLYLEDELLPAEVAAARSSAKKGQ